MALIGTKSVGDTLVFPTYCRRFQCQETRQSAGHNNTIASEQVHGQVYGSKSSTLGNEVLLWTTMKT